MRSWSKSARKKFKKNTPVAAFLPLSIVNDIRIRRLQNLKGEIKAKLAGEIGHFFFENVPIFPLFGHFLALFDLVFPIPFFVLVSHANVG